MNVLCYNSHVNKVSDIIISSTRGADTLATGFILNKRGKSKMKGDKITAIRIIEARNFAFGLNDTFEDAKFLGWYGWGTMRKFIENNAYILNYYAGE